MELQTLKEIFACGDKFGSAFREIMRDLKVDDLTCITKDQAQLWLAEKKRGGKDEP